MRKIAEEKGLGFKGMTEEQKNDFMQSAEMKRNGVKVLNNKQSTVNFNAKTVHEMFGIDLEDRLSHNCFKCDSIDLDTFYDIVERSSVLQDFISKGNSVYPMFEYLCQDLYLGLNMYNPKVLPIEDIHASARINRKLAELYINTPQFIKFRGATKQDNELSMVAMQSIAKRLLEVLTEFAAQNKEAMEKLDDIMKKEKEIDDIMSNPNMPDENNGNILGPESGSGGGAGITIEQARQLANQMAQELDDVLDITKINNSSNNVIHEAYQDPDFGYETIEEYRNVMESWGFGVGENCRISYENKIPDIKHILNSTKLKPLTDMIGRFRTSAKEVQKKKVKDVAVEIVSVNTGDDIQSMLPSELLRLSNSKLKPSFYSDYSEKRLMQYEKNGTRSKNKGPIIMCIDTSGSMRGQKEQWSKAMAMAVAEIAHAQKRAFAAILYDSHADDPIVLEKDEINPSKLIEICEKFKGGGTSFESPLRKAVNVIEKHKVFKDADIMFISDGDCSVSDNYLREFKKKKEDLEFNVQGVIINTDRYKQNITTLNDFCENVTDIRDIAELMDENSDTNKNLFASL